ITAPIKHAQRCVRRGRLRIHIERRFEFAFRSGRFLSPRIEGPQRKVVARTILVRGAKTLDELSGFLEITRGDGGIGQQQKRLFVSRLVLENECGSVARLRKLAEGKKGKG